MILFSLRRLFVLLGLLALALGSTAQARWDARFTVRKKIVIDTSATGTPIAGTIGGATVLVRLHDGNFQFESAKEDGSDLRFLAADDKTLLPFHLEKFDALLHEGLAWVKLPAIAPGARTEFWLYYGNPAAERAGDAKASYDAETVLVYHFAEPNTNPVDSTGSGLAAQSGAPTVGTLLGNGIRLGTPPPVILPGAAPLAWTAGGSFTWSAWVKVAAPAPEAWLFSRHDGGGRFGIGVDNGVPFLAVGSRRAAAEGPISTGDWHQVAAVGEPGKVTLYVDGKPAATCAEGIPALSGPAYLGGDPAAGETSVQGELDELEIARVARAPGFIEFTAIEQAGEKAAKIITYGDEEKGGGSFLGDSYFGIILRNLTPDGWAVIVILALMAVVTWVVVIGKWRYLRQVGAGNALFLGEWKRQRDRLAAIEEAPNSFGQALPTEGRRQLARSPLFNVFRIGMEEIAQRVAGQPAGSREIHASSLPAVRAELEAGLVAEVERLNSGIVLLTIAISGGPFLGLLGTVVGVMITFAAVAAAGDVNVNAIAPGIAAALLATVAGLAVAIPALFAYNYLLVRIKAATRDLHVFAESFLARVSEQYRGLSQIQP